MGTMNIDGYVPMHQFRFWCQKVLPLVYDNSLSYYEILCKCVDMINQLIENDKAIAGELEDLRKDLEVVQKWIDNFDDSFMQEVVDHWIATMVMFGLNSAGYFVAYIPKTWKNVKFATTEYDITIPFQREFGHLVLAY